MRSGPGRSRRSAGRWTSTSRRPRSWRPWSGLTGPPRSRPRRSTRSATWTRSATTRSPSGSGRPAPARRSWLSPSPPRRSAGGRSTGSSSPGPRLGFLPGDLMAKVDPYLRPLFDALHDMLDPERVSQHLERGVIEVAPLAFMRGRTLNDSFVILDEAQNTTPEQMKMFLTRLGFGSRMVVTGDITQIDLPREQQSGLIAVAEVLEDIEGVEFVRFGGEDVVRHKLVQRIVEAYDVHSQGEAPSRQAAAAAKQVVGGSAAEAGSRPAIRSA